MKRVQPSNQAEQNTWAILDRFRPSNDRDLAIRLSRELQTGPVQMMMSEKPTHQGAVAEFYPWENKIRMGRDSEFDSQRPETMVHEMQHALDYRKNPIEAVYANTEKRTNEGPGFEHHVGLPGVEFSDYLGEALPFIKTEEQGSWLGREGAAKREEILTKYPWLSKVEAGKSNRIPTPWDLPNAPTLQRQVRDYVRQQE